MKDGSEGRVRLVWKGNRSNIRYRVSEIVLEVSITKYNRGYWARKQFKKSDIGVLLVNLFGESFPPADEFYVEEVGEEGER